MEKYREDAYINRQIKATMHFSNLVYVRIYPTSKGIIGKNQFIRRKANLFIVTSYFG